MARTAQQCYEIAQKVAPTTSGLHELLDDGFLSAHEVMLLIQRGFTTKGYQQIFYNILGIGPALERLSFDQAFRATSDSNLTRHRFDKLVGSKSVDQRIFQILKSNDPQINPLLEQPPAPVEPEAEVAIDETGPAFIVWCRRMSALAAQCPVRLTRNPIGPALHQIAASASRGESALSFFVGPLSHRAIQQWVQRLQEELPAYGLSVALTKDVTTADGQILIVRW